MVTCTSTEWVVLTACLLLDWMPMAILLSMTRMLRILPMDKDLRHRLLGLPQRVLLTRCTGLRLSKLRMVRVLLDSWIPMSLVACRYLLLELLVQPLEQHLVLQLVLLVLLRQEPQLELLERKELLELKVNLNLLLLPTSSMQSSTLWVISSIRLALVS